MEVKIIEEYGYIESLYGLGLSRGITTGMSYNEFLQDEKIINRLKGVSLRLSQKSGGHNKFLESIQVWININAPRYWWQQLDTYRIGITKQSESTMYTLLNGLLFQSHFESPIKPHFLKTLNILIKNKDFDGVKNMLPEGFLQKRIVNTNYKTLQSIVIQRKNHKLPQWQMFITEIKNQIKHGELLC